MAAVDIDDRGVVADLRLVRQTHRLASRGLATSRCGECKIPLTAPGVLIELQ